MSLFDLQLALAVVLDLLLGDPRFLPHPVRLIGMFCSACERIWRRSLLPEYLSGLLTVLSVLFLSLGSTAFVLWLAGLISPLAVQVLAVFLLYTSFAARSLVEHSRVVFRALNEGEGLDNARNAVAQIVGRDTAALDRTGIIRACVETVAENMVDGITAPVFYAVVGSLLSGLTGLDPLVMAVLGAMGYKAVNTMDSMFGYRNDSYLYFGRAAARLDDLVNLLPARISGLILIPAAFVLGLDWRGALRILRRDRLAHASPNAAHSEAAVAGALGVILGGTSFYFGEKVIKATIGDNRRELEDRDIPRTNSLILLASLLFLLLMLILRYSLYQLLI